MAESVTDPRPIQAVERDLHRRLLDGDSEAPSELATRYLEPLAAWLRRLEPRVDPHLAETAAIDSILILAERPERYRPERGSLFGYLRMDALGDLRNTLKSERRRAARRAPLEHVEDRAAARNLSREDTADPLELVVRREAVDWDQLVAIYEELDERERAVVELIGEGERRTEAFVPLIGLEHLPPEEQKREVKRWKDRLVKRLRRRLARGKRDG